MKTIEDLDVYQKMHEVLLCVYQITSRFPRHEIFGLASQMRRAAISVNSNLSEGSARHTKGEFKQFIGIARGSAAELKYQVLIAKDLKYLAQQEYEKLIGDITDVSKMLTGLSKSLT